MSSPAAGSDADDSVGKTGPNGGGEDDGKVIHFSEFEVTKQGACYAMENGEHCSATDRCQTVADGPLMRRGGSGRREGPELDAVRLNLRCPSREGAPFPDAAFVNRDGQQMLTLAIILVCRIAILAVLTAPLLTWPDSQSSTRHR